MIRVSYDVFTDAEKVDGASRDAAVATAPEDARRARGLSGAKASLLGGVSHAVVRHADRAVLVVPSPDLATRRHEHLHRDLARA